MTATADMGVMDWRSAARGGLPWQAQGLAVGCGRCCCTLECGRGAAEPAGALDLLRGGGAGRESCFFRHLLSARIFFFSRKLLA
jgi:hypothetical protein